MLSNSGRTPSHGLLRASIRAGRGGRVRRLDSASAMSSPLDSRTGLPVVAMVGGGQLARMTHQAAIALGQSLRVLSTGPTESAALVAADVRLGDHRDLAALRELAEGATVVT